MTLLLLPQLNQSGVCVSIYKQELLSVAVGPRSDEEPPTGYLIQTLLHRTNSTLTCKKVRGKHKADEFLWLPRV